MLLLHGTCAPPPSTAALPPEYYPARESVESAYSTLVTDADFAPGGSLAFLTDLDTFTFGYHAFGRWVSGYGAVPRGAGPYPVLIVSRPGTVRAPRWNRGRAALELGRWARRGYFVVSYELGRDARDLGADQLGGADVDYVHQLIHRVSDFGRADASRIGLYGHSRGGMMCLQALRASHPAVKGVAVSGTPTDFVDLLAVRPAMDTLYRDLIPGYDRLGEVALRERSALDFIDELPTDVPILIQHGVADNRVPVRQAEWLAAALTDYGVPNELILYADDDHNLGAHRREADQANANFFARVLAP